MTFDNELKPPLDEAMEHYGVKGMKWGVRRSESQLARARGDKPPSRSKQIKTARKKVLSKRAQEQKNAPSLKAKASIALLGEASKHLSDEYLSDPDRLKAFQKTTGEKVAAVLTGETLLEAVVDRSLQKNIKKTQGEAAVRLLEKEKKMNAEMKKLLEYEKLSDDEFNKLMVKEGYEEE